VAARIPGEEGEIREAELVCELRHPPGMLMAAMQQDDRAARRPRQGRPSPIEQLGAVVAAKSLLLNRAGG
jgi:hypothetical protein